MDIKITGAKTGLFPVWLLSYKNGKRIAYAAVNGSTGKVAADIPLDIGKFLLGCLIGVIRTIFFTELISYGEAWRATGICICDRCACDHDILR